MFVNEKYIKKVLEVGKSENRVGSCLVIYKYISPYPEQKSLSSHVSESLFEVHKENQLKILLAFWLQ